jgi:hypothetical protein
VNAGSCEGVVIVFFFALGQYAGLVVKKKDYRRENVAFDGFFSTFTRITISKVSGGLLSKKKKHVAYFQ